MRLSHLLLVTTLFTASAAFAETETVRSQPDFAPIDSQGGGAIPALPLDVMSNGTITYINGGIGDEELAELKSKKHDFNLHLLLTGQQGEFVSDVNLRIGDANGKVVMAVEDAGPYVYVHLPQGNYSLEATSLRDSTVKKLTFAIKATGSVDRQLNFAEPGGITTDHQPTATIN